MEAAPAPDEYVVPGLGAKHVQPEIRIKIHILVLRHQPAFVLDSETCAVLLFNGASERECGWAGEERGPRESTAMQSLESLPSFAKASLWKGSTANPYAEGIAFSHAFVQPFPGYLDWVLGSGLGSPIVFCFVHSASWCHWNTRGVVNAPCIRRAPG